MNYVNEWVTKPLLGRAGYRMLGHAGYRTLGHAGRESILRRPIRTSRHAARWC